MDMSGLTSQWTLGCDGTLRVKMTSVASVLVFAGLSMSFIMLMIGQFFGSVFVFAIAAGFAIDRLALSPEAKDFLQHIERHRPG